MAERKSDKDTARIEALKARIIALEDVCEHLLKARACRISERERAERRKAEWDAGLPQRLAVFQEKFIEKRCILGRGRAVFQVFIAKAYREFCGDCEADCRAPTNQEIAEAERDAFQRGDRFYRYPERIPAVAVDHGLWLTESELSNAVLALTDVQASQGTNVHGTKDAIYEGLSLRDAFRYENCEPVSQMAPGRLVIT